MGCALDNSRGRHPHKLLREWLNKVARWEHQGTKGHKEGSSGHLNKWVWAIQPLVRGDGKDGKKNSAKI